MRWWHASADAMKRFLNQVGVPDDVIGMIPDICDTCKVCRMWRRPGPANVCSINLTDRFNQIVETDLLFIDRHVILHFIDRCTRWHAAGIVKSKDEDDMIDGIRDI